MRTSRLAAVALGLVGIASPAAAQRIGTVEAGVHIQYTKFDDILRLDNRIGGGGELGLFVLPNLAAEVGYSFVPTTGPVNGDITYRPFHARLVYNIPLADRTKIMVGGGYTLAQFSGDTTKNEWEDGFHVLGGLKFYMTPSWHLRLGAQWDKHPSPGPIPAAERAANKDGYSIWNFTAGIGFTYPPIEKCVVTIEPSSATILQGGTQQFRTSGHGEKTGRECGVKGTWSSDDNAISSTGLYTGRASGTHTITFSPSGSRYRGPATATVTVRPILQSIAIAPKTTTIDVGQTVQFTVSGRMSDNSAASGLSPRFSADCSSVGTVDASGTFRGTGPGTCTVTATVTTEDNRTLTDNAQVTVNQPPPPPPPAPAPEPIRVLAKVYFALGSDALSRDARNTLNRALVDSLKATEGPIHISGHADTIPPARTRGIARTPEASRRFNERLSQRRADRVAAYLVRQGIPRARIQTHAYSFCKPAVPSEPPMQDPKGQPQNRRVEVGVQTDPSANLVSVCSGSPGGGRP